ncbi:hypothetical protein SNE40_016475 [Patella caerulea]|uniref:Tryptophan synthase beta chain-like PALP domain-containing protein n=1 Tax=Patella caerulea TaxID=87958 RepID=A0AAN8JD67_PATCE
MMKEETYYREDNRDELFVYQPANWMKPITNIPKYRMKLTHENTPIHRWNLPGVPCEFKIFIKRDDMTGCTLSGNKVRKLDFLLADAISQGYKQVITVGQLQSNHCRSVAIAAREVGMTSHLMMLANKHDDSKINLHGNMLLNCLSASNIYVVQKSMIGKAGLDSKLENLRQHIQSTTGEKCYTIPVGGSNEVGVFGYIETFREMMNQNICERFDDVVVTSCGLGNTLAGLAIGNYLTGSHLRCHGIDVSEQTNMVIPSIDEILTKLGLHHVKAEDIVNVIPGYHGKGYGLSTQEELEFITMVGKKTGIVLDPVYTGKAVLGLVQILNKRKDMFKGKRILFIHTGGIFIATDGRLTDMLSQSEQGLQQLVTLPEV